MRRLRVGHYYPRLNREHSGVTAAIRSWAEALQEDGHSSVLLADGRDEPPAGETLEHRAVRHAGNRRATFVPRDLRGQLAGLDLVYLHEGWTTGNVVAARACRAAGVPYVVMPHGVYESGILETLKVLPLRRAAEQRVLERALAVHVYFESETALVRAMAPSARCLVAPTGAQLPAATWQGSGGYAAWFGRYEPHHKGLDLLLAGLAKVPDDRRPSVRLRGYDYQGGMDRVRELVRELRLEASVTVGGEIRGEEKETFLAQAGAYLHPSRWESHSIALVEVLGRGVPVAVSESIHIAADLAARNAALLAPASAAGWATLLSDERLLGDASRGERGRRFVSEALAWPVVLNRWERELELAGLA